MPGVVAASLDGRGPGPSSPSSERLGPPGLDIADGLQGAPDVIRGAAVEERFDHVA